MEKAIGIDLGGTDIVAALVDEEGNIKRRLTIPTLAKEGKDFVLLRIKSLINSLMIDDLKGIGIGTPGDVDINTGKLVSKVENIPGWSYIDLRSELKKYYDLPILVENDANIATICEAWIGHGKNLDNFIMITLGTGVGGEIYTRENGLWYGENYSGLEIGHTIIYPGGRKCRCGLKGCAAKYVSGTAIQDNYKDLTGEWVKGREVFRRYYKDLNAKKSIDKFTLDLAKFLVLVEKEYGPKKIIIGGGVINSRRYWMDDVKVYFANNSDSNINIEAAKFMNDAGVIGAARMVFSYLEGSKIWD